MVLPRVCKHSRKNDRLPTMGKNEQDVIKSAGSWAEGLQKYQNQKNVDAHVLTAAKV